MKLVLPNRSNSNSPSTGAMTMPCRPSKPPVMFEKRLASSRSSSAMPSVTISRVRSAPRMTRNEVTKPSAMAARPAMSSASTGSSM